MFQFLKTLISPKKPQNWAETILVHKATFCSEIQLAIPNIAAVSFLSPGVWLGPHTHIKIKVEYPSGVTLVALPLY